MIHEDQPEPMSQQNLNRDRIRAADVRRLKLGPSLTGANGENRGIPGLIRGLIIRGLIASQFPQLSPVRNSRLHLPSLFWRYATGLLIICLLGTDPRLDFWSARAACEYPTNPSTDE